MSGRWDPIVHTTLLHRAGSATAAAVLSMGIAAPAFAATSPTPSAPASSVTGSRAESHATFGVQPAGSSARDGRPAFTYGATRGAVLTDHVAVLNYALSPVHLSVYAADAVNAEGGGLTAPPGARKPTDLGSWISLPIGARAGITVPPATTSGPGQVLLPFELRVPWTATPGDHTALILAVLSSVSNTPGTANVRLDQRVGARVYLRVSGQLNPSLRIDDLVASYQGTLNPVGRGTVTLDYTITNNGNVKLGALQHDVVTGLLGTSASAAPPATSVILPGNSVQEHVVVDGAYPTFVEHADVELRPVAAQGDADPALPPVVTTTTVWAIPWPLIVLIVSLAALAYWLWRRHAHAPQEPAGRRMATPVGGAPTGRRMKEAVR